MIQKQLKGRLIFLAPFSLQLTSAVQLTMVNLHTVISYRGSDNTSMQSAMLLM